MARAVTARELARARREEQEARRMQRVARRHARERGQADTVRRPAGRGWVDTILGR